MRVASAPGPRRTRCAAATCILGGLLWIPYGLFEFLQPWGVDTIYRENRGYEVVTDPRLYWVYSLPGSLALLLTALGLLGVLGQSGPRTGWIGRVTLVLTYIAVVLAVLTVAGGVVQFDPLFTGPRILGTLALGAATLLVGVKAHRAGVTAGWTVSLLALGLIGLFLFPLWPLVYAIEVLPEGAGAGIIAVYGFGWVLLGYRLWLGQAQGLPSDR